MSFWLPLALLFRLIASLTHASWNHPDEWFQTVELSRILTLGVGANTQEVSLHLRNLSWPWFLGIPTQWAHFIDPENVRIRVLAIQFFTSLVDLFLLLGASLYFKKLPGTEGWKSRWLALFVVPAFLVDLSVRPSGEHISSVLTLLSIGLISSGWSFFAGFVAIGIGAVKYPALLCTAAITIWALLNPKRVHRLHFILGMATGVFVFGLADWRFYGRPWESLWMYLQYNLFTGLSHSRFGSQGLDAYLPTLFDIFGGYGLPLGLLVLVTFGAAVWVYRPWQNPKKLFTIKDLNLPVFCLFFYGVGHALVAHKEPRFIIPMVPLILLAVGEFLIRHETQIRHAFQTPLKQSVQSAWVASFVVLNAIPLGKTLWGDHLRLEETYLEVTQQLERTESACAIITVRRPLSTLLPGPIPGKPPLGFWPAHARENPQLEIQSKPLIWIESRPSCVPGNKILLHASRPNHFFVQQGCLLRESGILRYLPNFFWDWVAQNPSLHAGPWYECPHDFEALFTKSEVRSVLAWEFPRIDSLPPYGVGGEIISQLIKQKNDATLGDW